MNFDVAHEIARAWKEVRMYRHILLGAVLYAGVTTIGVPWWAVLSYFTVAWAVAIREAWKVTNTLDRSEDGAVSSS